jgi:hypothetical protein
MSADANPLRRTWLLVLFWAEVLLAAVAAVLAVATCRAKERGTRTHPGNPPRRRTNHA